MNPFKKYMNNLFIIRNLYPLKHIIPIISWWYPGLNRLPWRFRHVARGRLVLEILYGTLASRNWVKWTPNGWSNFPGIYWDSENYWVYDITAVNGIDHYILWYIMIYYDILWYIMMYYDVLWYIMIYYDISCNHYIMIYDNPLSIITFIYYRIIYCNNPSIIYCWMGF